MTVKPLMRVFPELGVLVLLVLLGPACGGGGGGGTGFTVPGAGFTPSTPSVPGPMVNRTDGVAPMAVFCSAANAYLPGSTTTLLPQPSDGDYSAFQYAWDFGDPGCGNWTTTGLSKNSAIGFTAAHVYETPGTYTITLTLKDASGTPTVYTQSVVVAAFAGTTRYISSAGNDANDGLSPATSWQTVAKVFQNIASNTRYLFNRGDSFTTPGGFTVTAPGPSLIGSYGTGALPIINVTAYKGGIRFSASDWVVTDLEFAGPGFSDQFSAIQFEETKQIRRILLQRLTVHDFRVCLGWTDWPTMYSTPHEGNVISECFAFNPSVNGFYVGGQHLALLGNTVQDCTGSHIVRVWQAHKAAISHNIFVRPGGDRHSLKLHGPSAGDGRPETQFVTVSNNVFQGNVWMVVLGPQDTVHDERISQVIYERNISNMVPTTQVALMIKAREVTVRNNIFIGTGASKYFAAVGVGQAGGIEPPAKNVRILNNTVYRADAGSEFSFATFNVRLSDVWVQNNIGSAPGTPASSCYNTLGACPNLTADHNLISNSAGFVNPGGGDFHLSAGSPGIDAGATLIRVPADYSGTARPVGAAYDLGAYEQ